MRALRVLCVTLAAALMLLMTLAMMRRVPFPFELEWMEGGTLLHVQRLLAGQPLYVRPSLDFVPFAYPPLYYWTCAPFAWLLGSSFTALRVVSVLSTAATVVLVWLIVRRENGNIPGLLAAGLSSGCYALSDGWLDLGRVDALYLALLAATWLAASKARSVGQWIMAGAITSLAFLAKQPALLTLAPLGVYLAVRQRRDALVYAVTVAALSAAVFAALDWTSEGWYGYYVMTLPRLRMGVSSGAERLATFWTADLLPVALAAAVGIHGAITRKHWRHLALAAGCIAASWMARMEGGAWNNAVLPAYLAVAILFGLAFRGDGRRGYVVYAAAALQLALLLHDPRRFMPDSADAAAGRAIVDTLKGLPGPVLVLDHNSWSTFAGLPEHAHGWAVTDVVWADRSVVGRALEDEVRGAVAAQRFGAIVTDGGRSWFQRDIERFYRQERTIGGTYVPRSGAPRRPRLVFVPRSPVHE